MNRDEETPCAVLVHGFMQNARTWDEVRSLLPGGLAVVCPSLSPASPDRASLDDLAAQVHIASKDRVPCVFVGYSMGGRVLQAYARRYPGTIQALVLESAGIGPETEGERAAFGKRNAEWADYFETAESPEEAVAWWESLPIFRTQSETSAAVQRETRAMRMSCNLKKLGWATRSAGAHTMPLAPTARAQLAALPCPVHYIYGTHDRKYAAVAQTLVPYGVELHSLEAGHNVHMEQPEAYADLLVRIVASAAKANHSEQQEEGTR